MGLDVPNVRMVVHWQQPASVEDYLQEFGRAGRDGRRSIAIIFYTNGARTNDIDLLNFMAERAVENSSLALLARSSALAHKRRQIVNLANLLGQRNCFRQALISYFEGSN